MRIIKYGVTLRRIEETDTELIRMWRNDEKIRKNMLFQEYITPEMQKKWFDSVNNFNYTYYIIEYNNEKIGLINETNIDNENKTVESGLFLFGDKYHGSVIPIIASLILLELGIFLDNGNTSFIQVKKDNIRAIDYNKKIGYYIHEEKEDHFVMVITKQSFENNALKLRDSIKNLYGDQNMRFILEPVDFKNGVAQTCLKILKCLSEEKIIHKEIGNDYVEVTLNI